MNGKVARKKPEQTTLNKPLTNSKDAGGTIQGLSELNNPLDSIAQLSPDGLQDMQQTYGNGFLQRLIGGQKEVSNAPDGEAGSLVSDDVEEGIDASRGGGSPIPDAFRKRMEGHFDADFSQTRLHTDDQADTLSRSLGARSFTSGSDIFFKQGEYDPNSHDGQKLLAHELTHVTQQGGARSSRAQAKLSVNEPGDIYEQEADAAAEAAVNAPAPTEDVETPPPPTEEGAIPASGDLALPAAESLQGQDAVDMGQVKALGNQVAQEVQAEIGAPPTEVQVGEEQREGGSADPNSQATTDSTPPDDQQKAKSDENAPSNEGATQAEAKKEDGEKKKEDKKKEEAKTAVPKIKKKDPSTVEEMKFQPEDIEEPEPTPLLPSWNELAYGTVQRVSDTVPDAVDSYDLLVGAGPAVEDTTSPDDLAPEDVDVPDAQSVDREDLIGQAFAAGILSGVTQGASEFITDQFIEEVLSNTPGLKKIPYVDGLMSIAQIAADPAGWAQGVKSTFGKEGFTTMTGGFTAIHHESTWAGYTAAILEALIGLIDWINNMLGIVTQVLQVLLFALTALATALAATGFLAKLVAILLKIIAFLEKVLNVISAIVFFLQYLKPILEILAIIFRSIDIKLFEGDPQKLMEKQAKLTGLVTGFFKGATTRALDKGWEKTKTLTKAGISNQWRKWKAAELADNDRELYVDNRPKTRDNLKQEYREKYGSDPEVDAKRDRGDDLDLADLQKEVAVKREKHRAISNARDRENNDIRGNQHSDSKKEQRRGEMDAVTREPEADYNKRLDAAMDEVQTARAKRDAQKTIDKAKKNIEDKTFDIGVYNDTMSNAHDRATQAQTDIFNKNRLISQRQKEIEDISTDINNGGYTAQELNDLNQRKMGLEQQRDALVTDRDRLRAEKDGHVQSWQIANELERDAKASIRRSRKQKAEGEATLRAEDKKGLGERWDAFWNMGGLKGVAVGVADVGITGAIGEPMAKTRGVWDSAKALKTPFKHGSLEEMQKGWAGQRHSGGITGQTAANATAIATWVNIIATGSYDSWLTGENSIDPQQELGALAAGAVGATIPTQVSDWGEKYAPDDLNTITINTGLPDLGETGDGQTTWEYDGKTDIDDVSDPPTTATLTRSGDYTTEVKSFGTCTIPHAFAGKYTVKGSESPITMTKCVTTESGSTSTPVTFSSPTLKNFSRDSDGNVTIELEYEQNDPSASTDEELIQTKRDESVSRQRSSGLIVQRKEDEEVVVPTTGLTTVQRQTDEEVPLGGKPQAEETSDSAGKADDLTDALTEMATEIGSQDALEEDALDDVFAGELEADEEDGGMLGGARSQMEAIRRAKIAEMIEELEEPPASAIEQVDAAAAAYEVVVAEEEVAFVRQQELEGAQVDVQSQGLELEAAQAMGVANQQALATHQADIDEKLVAQDEQEALSKDAGKVAEEGSSSSNPIEALMQMIVEPLTKVLTGVVTEFVDIDTSAGQKGIQESGKAAGAPADGTDMGMAGARAGVSQANQRRSDTVKTKGEAKKSEQALGAYNQAMESGREGAQEGQEAFAMLGEQNLENLEMLAEDKATLVDAHEEGQDEAETWADEHFADRDAMFAELEAELEVAVEEESER